MSKTRMNERRRNELSNRYNHHADRAHFKPLKHNCDERDWDAQLQSLLNGDWADDDGVEQEVSCD